MPLPRDISRLRAERDAALASAIASEDRAGAIDRALASAIRAGRRDDATRLGRERVRLQRAAQAARRDYNRLDDAALGGLVGWLERSPEDIVSACTDAFPFVLFPVRLETKFVRIGASTELRVRFFPDDIAVSPPLAAPTEAERSLGIEYWRARSRARHAADDHARTDYRGAWAALAKHCGPHRAGYVVRALTPINPEASLEEFVFPEPSTESTLPIARAQGLPDRFVVLLFQRDPTTRALNQVARAIGSPIPDTLVLAPNAEQPESWLTRDEATGRIVVPDALRWLVDFEAARSSGMAVSIPVAPPFDQTGYDRVIALGVRGATPPEEGPAALGEILSRHRYADGCAIVSAGTPTNNSDSAASGWPTDLDEEERLFAIEDEPPDTEPRDGLLGTSDGWRLSRLFGLDPELARRLPNAGQTDIAEVLAMNRALVPGTLDDFVAEFLRTVVSPQMAAELHRFFVSWVSGRGFYPALRVGRQPYGIVVTSAWDRWHPRDHTPVADGDIASAIFDLLGRHRFRWQLLAQRAPHAALQGMDPFERLIAIVGLLASSTTFVSRKAVSDAYIHERLCFGAAADAATTAWFKELQTARTGNLAAVDFPAATGATDPLLAFIAFLRETSDWRLPIVDRDPKIPLSETAPVGSYDGAHNYLWWLAQASRADIAGERFAGADGAPVAAPSALLYVLLRHAMLAALESASLAAAAVHGSQFFDVIARDALIANIGGEQHIQRRDYLEVDASRLGLADRQTPLADWVLAGSRRPQGERPSAAERLAEVQEAIAALAALPTARLERLMAEHVDLCSYRIDAWITALYSRRLELLRTRTATPGLHLGAFGWVENLLPATGRRPLSIEALPPELREGLVGPVFEDSSNGGYVHAPSLGQATTAAVLRNGYLSHATSDQPLPFSVNLSSARMRAAVALATGLRAGQPIAALLGYQFERGLHEGHPGVELDQFIAVLRDRFPLVSGRITETPPATSAELVEARNVVDGLALADATRNAAYPYGMSILPASGSAAAIAIASEVDRVHDALDATSDLLMAESVHQAVQGNLSRTVAAQQAMTSPAVPPEADVIETPRSGRALSFRATIAFDVERIEGWNGPLTPRAGANPHLNHWLSKHLPPPDDISWSVRVGQLDPVHQSMRALELEPLDLVLMSGERLGDRSSELERYIIRMFQSRHAADQGASFDFTATPRGTSLAALHPLLLRLRRLITAARAAHAADWRRAADGAHAAPGDPTGSASGHARLDGFSDLRNRLEIANQSLRTAHAELIAALAGVEPLQAALRSDPASIGNAAWASALERLRRALFALTLFGIPEALPANGDVVTATLADRLILQGRSVATLVSGRLARAGELLAVAPGDPLPTSEVEGFAEMARRNGVQRDHYLEAGKTLLGAAFVITPLFQFASDQIGEVAASMAAPPARAAAVEEWLLSLARVRPRMADLSWVLAAARWSGYPLADPAAVQFPHQPAAPWIAGTFGSSLPTGEWLSMLVVGSDATSGPLQAGLLVDDWTETVPGDRETTGVAFNFDRPNAVAPQALLVAVPPVLRGNWMWEDLVGSVHEALDLAAIRAVEPDTLLTRDENTPSPAGDYFQVLPAILAEFTAGRVVTADFAARVAAVLAQLRP